MNPMPLFDLPGVSITRRLRAILFGAAMTALAWGLAAMFAVLALGSGALAAYAALSAAEGPVVAAMIAGGLCAGLALAIFAIWAWRARAARRAAARRPPKRTRSFKRCLRPSAHKINSRAP